MIKEFYKPFAENLEQKYEEVSEPKLTADTTDKTRPQFGRPPLLRLRRQRRFLACGGCRAVGRGGDSPGGTGQLQRV